MPLGAGYRGLDRWTGAVLIGCCPRPPAAIQWVADHRRHHAYTDRDGDPYSPWRYGTTVTALFKGLLFAHCGWLFRRQPSNRARFAPDLLADPDITRVDRMFGLLVVALLARRPSAGC